MGKCYLFNRQADTRQASPQLFVESNTTPFNVFKYNALMKKQNKYDHVFFYLCNPSNKPFSEDINTL